MKEQIIKINVPDGYKAEYDSKSQTVKFVKIERFKPKTWDEYCKNTSGKKYYISSLGPILSTNVEPALPKTNRSLLNSMEEAEAFLALMQLRSLRKAWVGDWEPDYSGKEKIWHVHTWRNCNIEIDYFNLASRPLSFPTEEMAREFAECFKDLIGQAKILL